MNDQQQITLNKINEIKEYFIAEIKESATSFFVQWYFLSKNCNYEPYLCNDCQEGSEGSDYGIHFLYMSKDDVIKVMNNSNLYQKSRLF